MQFLPEMSRISWQEFKQPQQRSMPTCEGVFERMPWSALPPALTWTEDASNTNLLELRDVMIGSSDSLLSLTVTCVLKDKRYTT
jgi:hypothetical protein